MRPLFSEMIAEMLMECARIQVNSKCDFYICIKLNETIVHVKRATTQQEIQKK